MFKKIGVVVLGLISVPAMAAVDISAEVAALSTDGLGAIAAVGAVLIALASASVVYKWAKRMFFS